MRPVDFAELICSVSEQDGYPAQMLGQALLRGHKLPTGEDMLMTRVLLDLRENFSDKRRATGGSWTRPRQQVLLTILARWDWEHLGMVPDSPCLLTQPISESTGEMVYSRRIRLLDENIRRD